MPPTHHHMTAEADNGEEVLFACSVESCGRRFVLRRSGGLTIIDSGDPFATHSGSVGGLGMDSSIDA